MKKNNKNCIIVKKEIINITQENNLSPLNQKKLFSNNTFIENSISSCNKFIILSTSLDDDQIVCIKNNYLLNNIIKIENCSISL